MAFTGFTVPIPLGEFGLMGTKNLATIPPTALIQARSIALDQGTVRRAGGSALYTATPITGAPKIRGLHDHFADATTQRLLAFTNAGKLLKDDGTGTFGTTLKTGLNVDGLPVFAEGGAETLAANRKTFLTTGFDVVQVLAADGATTANLTTPPADWSGANQPRFLIPHNGRMWGGLLHRIYASLATNHEDFTGAGVVQLPIYPGVGSYLQGGISFNNRLWLWKYPKGLFWLDDSDVSSANWRIYQLSLAHSLAGPNAMDVADNDVCFMDANLHIHLLSGVQEFGDVKASDLTAANDMGPWVRENLAVNKDAAEHVWGRYYADKKEMWFACRRLGSTVNNINVIVDFNRPGRPRIRFEDKDECEALCMRRDAAGIPRPVVGDSTGTVWLLDRAGIDKAGAGYTSEWQTPHDDLGWFDPRLKSVRKNWKWVEAITQPTGEFLLYLDVWQEGDLKQSLTMSQGFGGAALGSFILGTSRLGGDFLMNKRRRLRGSSRRISFVGRMNESGADFSVSQLILGCTTGRSKE